MKLLLLIFLPLSLWAAKPQPQWKQLLKMDGKQRIFQIEKDKKARKSLRQVAFSKRQHLKNRWHALSSLLQSEYPGRKKDLTRAFQSSDWFMRDLALKVGDQVSKKMAIHWSRKLLNDPALVVRTTAVKSIQRLQDKDSWASLWKQLYSKQNFDRGRSLWVRKHIVRTIASFETRSYKPSKKKIHAYRKLLLDKDETLHAPTIAALEKFTGEYMGDVKRNPKLVRETWLEWTKKQI